MAGKILRPGDVGAAVIRAKGVVINPQNHHPTRATKAKTVEGKFDDTTPGVGIRAIRPRGSEFGQYTDESGSSQLGWDEGENWTGADGRVPQIDPTPSSNPPRPRTLRAGYIKERGDATGTLWVVFRDGTPWEYYDVPQNVWRNFKRVKSPGRFINRTLNSYQYQRGNF